MSDLNDPQIDIQSLQQLVALARDEDLGQQGDITTAAVCDVRSAHQQMWSGELVARCPGVICGLRILPRILQAFEPAPAFRPGVVADGDPVSAGARLGTIAGSITAVLSSERLVLNFLQRLSGIASMTRQFVERVRDTPAKIYDTRKTTPGWRDLEKYAVRCGGGQNHRRGLHDAVLVKDNHLSGMSGQQLSRFAFDLLNRLHELGLAHRFVEFEVDNLEQFEALLDVVGIDIILLDNFTIDDLRTAVGLRDARGLKGKVAIEASGNVTLQRVRAIAETGVDRISVGALTHSTSALDIAMECQPASGPGAEQH